MIKRIVAVVLTAVTLTISSMALGTPAQAAYNLGSPSDTACGGFHWGIGITGCGARAR
ncbi:MAG TPA: hypothetical protein PKK40_01115 [Marmoricola sp.]|nr:hypothetical protein [Marmoricola sp.]